jgi:hypothetical protein
MIARPEPIQLEHLLDASFLGKLLVLPANVRLDWKLIARYKHYSLFGLIISNGGKRFITLTPGHPGGGGSAAPAVAFRVLADHSGRPALQPLPHRRRRRQQQQQQRLQQQQQH